MGIEYDISVVSVNLGQISKRNTIKRTLVTFPINKETTIILDYFYINPKENDTFYYVLHGNGNFLVTEGGDPIPAGKKIYQVKMVQFFVF